VGGYRFKSPQQAWGTGLNVVIDGNDYPWGLEQGFGDWGPVECIGIARSPGGDNDIPPVRLLIPAQLPPPYAEPWSKGIVRHVSNAPLGPTHGTPILASENLSSEQSDWQSLISGSPIKVPAQARRRVLIDLDDYICAYPELTISAGQNASVRIHWQECLFESEKSNAKGNRDDIEGKFFTTIWEFQDGIGDTFLSDGGTQRRYTTLWWQCGRFVEILVETADDPLTIEGLRFQEDRYPLENHAPFEASDPRLSKVASLGFRTLQMCSHETYMDCPYYEQLQYVGDTRLQTLVTYITNEDDRLPRQALLAFDRSRRRSGITQSRYPSRVLQVIPPFSLFWVGMIKDYALWRGDQGFVRSLMPGVRAVLDWFRAYVVEGLVSAPLGWNYVDWVPEWKGGMPPGAEFGVSAPINRLFEQALRDAAELESWLDEPELSIRNLRNAQEIAAAIHSTFWNSERGMYADDREHASFSEHTQVLSILTRSLPENVRDRVVAGLLGAPDLHRATIYFAHYLFEAFHEVGRTDLLLERLSLWYELLENGLRTTIEMPEPTRSDCHAWGAHPIYHFAATILGVRPTRFGGDHFKVSPSLGSLDWARGGVMLPNGLLSVSVEAGQITIEVPDGASVVYRGRGLGSGSHTFES